MLPTRVSFSLMKEWQIASGRFKVRSHRFGKSFFIDRDGFSIIYKVANYIKNKKGKMVSINDGYMSNDEYKDFIDILTESFETSLNKKSSYEI